MGCFGGYNSKDSVIQEVSSSFGFNKMVDKSVRGNHVWVLFHKTLSFSVPRRSMKTLKSQGIHVPFLPKCKRYLKDFHCVFLYILSKSDGEWTYKVITEFEGPCHYTCPLKFIRLSDVCTEFSLNWKSRCHKINENKKAVKNARYGTVFTVRNSKGQYPVKFYQKESNGFSGRELSSSHVTDKKLYRYDYSDIV